MASHMGHEKIVRQLLQSGARDIPNKVGRMTWFFIGMANYEKRVEQEAAYPIPISLYNCYRTVRHEKRGIAIYS